jgi:hypothetical protein
VLGRALGLICRQSLLPLLAAIALLVGCGGDDGSSDASKSSAPAADSTPKAKEPLSVAAKRLERALPRGDCKELVGLVLHSIQRGTTTPDAPPTKRDCAYIRYAARHDLRGFHLTKTREFGPAGFTEGSGATKAPARFLVGIVWLLDSDGSWKAAYEAIFRHQIDVARYHGKQADANARRALKALRTGDCPGLWRVLNPASRFVRGAGGRRDEYCRTLATLYRDQSTAFAQIKADGSPALEPLGQTHDLSFYGLRLKNGRYMDMVLSGALANAPTPELTQHDYPSMLELLTVRQPR